MCSSVNYVSSTPILSRKQDTNLSLGHEIPLFPWTKLATDLFHFERDLYLLLVDYTSHFSILPKLKSMTGQHIADHFRQIFAEYGWPGTIVSDNGPCYASEVFKGLMKEYQVNHITSLPHYPQSNGLAEKYVQIVKTYFTKQKKRDKIYINAWWYTEIPLYQASSNPLYRSYQAELPDPPCLYPMQQICKWV